MGAGTRQAQYISCILHIVAMLTQSSEIDDLAELVDCLADAVQLVVCACVQVRHMACHAPLPSCWLPCGK